MPSSDVSFCVNHECHLKIKCRKAWVNHPAPKATEWDNTSWAKFEPGPDGNCEYFKPIGGKNETKSN